MRKKIQENEQTLAELSSARLHSRAKCRLKQTSYFKRINLLAYHIINMLLTELNRSVWENLDIGLVYSCHDLGQDSPIQTSCPVNKS